MNISIHLFLSSCLCHACLLEMEKVHDFCCSEDTITIACLNAFGIFFRNCLSLSPEERVGGFKFCDVFSVYFIFSLDKEAIFLPYGFFSLGVPEPAAACGIFFLLSACMYEWHRRT